MGKISHSEAAPGATRIAGTCASWCGGGLIASLSVWAQRPQNRRRIGQAPSHYRNVVAAEVGVRHPGADRRYRSWPTSWPALRDPRTWHDWPRGASHGAPAGDRPLLIMGRHRDRVRFNPIAESRPAPRADAISPKYQR